MSLHSLGRVLGPVVEVSLDGDSEATSVDEEERGQDWLEH